MLCCGAGNHAMLEEIRKFADLKYKGIAQEFFNPEPMVDLKRRLI